MGFFDSLGGIGDFLTGVAAFLVIYFSFLAKNSTDEKKISKELHFPLESCLLYRLAVPSSGCHD